MKLGILKAAIRALDGAPKVYSADTGLTLHIQKTPLLAELDKVFPGGKAVETGLRLRDDGFIVKEPE